MKKECGYLDVDGHFHKTEYECNNANLLRRIQILRGKLYNKGVMAASYLEDFEFKYKVDYSRGRRLNNYDLMEQALKHLILSTSLEELIEIKTEKENIEKEIRSLEKLRDKPKVLRKDWWLGWSGDSV